MMNYIFLATGFEELEAISIYDFLCREELEVQLVSISKEKTVIGAHNLAIRADVVFDQVDFSDAKMLILPGGMPGARLLSECTKLNDLLIKHDRKNGLIAAICAAPMVLGKLGLLEGKSAVCYPGFEDTLLGAKVDTYVSALKDDNIITGKGPGCIFEFGYEIVSVLKSDQVAENLLTVLQYH